MSDAETSRLRGKTFPPATKSRAPAPTETRRVGGVAVTLAATPRAARAVWTPEMDARLTALCSGPPRAWAEIAAALGFSEFAVTARAARLGLRRSRGGARRPWSPAEDKTLLSLAMAGATLAHLAAEVRRSQTAVGRRLDSLLSRDDLVEARRAARRDRDDEISGRAESIAVRDRAAACDKHLADLARHHRVGCGELRIGPDRAVAARIFPADLVRSPGSPAALCAEA